MSKRIIMERVRSYAVGLAVGGGMIGVAVLLCALCGGVTVQPQESVPWGRLGLYLLGFMSQGAGEELIFRGLLLAALRRKLPLTAAVGVSSAVFALVHMGNSGVTPLAIFNLMLFGVFACVYMLRCGGIWGVCAMHTAWNYVQGCVLGLAVSGSGMDATMLVSTVCGHNAISGGSFGPEGGLAVTLVLAGGTAAAMWLPRKKI